MGFPNHFTIQEARDSLHLKMSFFLGPSQSWVEVGFCYLALPWGTGQAAQELLALTKDQCPLGVQKGQGRACPLWVAQVSEDPSENKIRGAERGSPGGTGSLQRSSSKGHSQGTVGLWTKVNLTVGGHGLSWSRRSDKAGSWLNCLMYLRFSCAGSCMRDRRGGLCWF